MDYHVRYHLATMAKTVAVNKWPMRVDETTLATYGGIPGISGRLRNDNGHFHASLRRAFVSDSVACAIVAVNLLFEYLRLGVMGINWSNIGYGTWGRMFNGNHVTGKYHHLRSVFDRV